MTNESIKQAEKMSKLMRERNQREIFSDDYYIESIRHSQIELEKSVSFLQRAMAEPKLFFTDANTELHSNKSMIFKAIDYRAREQKMGNQHDFQALLANKMNQYMQEWLRYHEIKAEVKVEVRNPLSFPSIFCVFYNDMEIIQFDIFEQWYGVRQKPLTEEEIIKQSENAVKTHEEQMAELKKQLADYENYEQNPWKYVKHPTDIVILLFKKKRLSEGLEKRIGNTQKRIKEEQSSIEKIKEGLPYQLDKRVQKQQGIDAIIPFFEEIQYKLETNEYKLY